MSVQQDLYAAPDVIKGADIWKLNWSYEQRTFSDYLRDGMVEGEDLIIASCADANDSNTQYCNGTFVTHLWGRKDEVRVDRVWASGFSCCVHPDPHSSCIRPRPQASPPTPAVTSTLTPTLTPTTLTHKCSLAAHCARTRHEPVAQWRRLQR